MEQPKKAVILLAGLGTRFLPLSKVVPKELWPLVDKPIVQYIIEEAINSGFNEIVFVLRPDNKLILEYVKKSPEIEKILKERNNNNVLEEIKKLDSLLKGVHFSYVFQKKPAGDGHAVLQVEKIIKEETFAVLFADDVIDSNKPALSQLVNVFKTSMKPVLSLYRLPKENLSSYGVVGVEKIANRHYKIKEIIEKPSTENAPSNLAVVGKYLLTPDIFGYLKKTKPTEKGEIILANSFREMLKDKKTIYGHEIDGEWLECGTKKAWLKSNIYLSLKNSQYKEELKEVIKKSNEIVEDI